MIGVIADDFTGAAEIGGVAVRWGLTAEVWSPANAAATTDAAGSPAALDVDVICLDTNTRACPPEVAARRVAQAVNAAVNAAANAAALAAGSPLFPAEGTLATLFKKTDSVLRGQVAAELTSLLDATGRQRVLLVPANPSLGRTIQDGRYLIQGTPLDQTHFAHDPEYPAYTADVATLVARPHAHAAGDAAGATTPVYVLDPAQTSEMATVGRGIIVGEARTHEDVVTWASSLDTATIPAGAAEFFGAFLEVHGFDRVSRALKKEDPKIGPILGRDSAALFVVGSTSDASRTFCQRCEAYDIPVIRMPMSLLKEEGEIAPWIAQWVTNVLRAFEGCSHESRSVVVAIDRPLRHAPGLPQRLTGYLATVTQRVLARQLARQPVSVIFVEGGATAVALVRHLGGERGWGRWRVKHELAPGSVSLKPVGKTGPLLVMKPGSYVWPEEVWPWTKM